MFPSKTLKLQTTASWDFVGLKKGKRARRNPSIESDTIILVSWTVESTLYPTASVTKALALLLRNGKEFAKGANTSLATSIKLLKFIILFKLLDLSIL